MTADERIDEHLRAANPVLEDEAGGWADSPEGREAFDGVMRMAALGDAGEPSRGAPRRARAWPRRLALAGVAAVALAALGISLANLWDGDDGGDAFVVSDEGEFFAVRGGESDDSGLEDGPPLLAMPVGPDAAHSHEDSSPQRVMLSPRASGAGSSAPGIALEAGAGGGEAGGAASTSGTREPALGRGPGAEIVKTAQLEIDVEERGIERAQAEVRGTVDRAGGFVASSERSPRSATLTVRIPADRFEAVLDEAEALGEVRQQSVSGEDVSAELVDVEARLRHWQAQETVLLELMEQATTVSESIDVRNELAPVQETIERLEGRLRALEDDVEFSTVTLFLVDPDVEVPGEPEPEPDEGWFSEVWDDATDLGSGIVRGTAIALGALVPIAVLWVAPLVGIAWLIQRRRTGSSMRDEDPA